MAKFIIRLDDICPHMDWRRFDAAEDAFDRLRIRPLLGVVPDNRDPRLMIDPPRDDFWDRMRAAADKRWTIAQHGFTHEYVTECRGSIGLAPRSEFAGLPLAEQSRKLAAGQAILRAEKLPADVFMAPAHSFDHHTLAALREHKFRYVTDGYGLWPYERAGLIFVPQLFASPQTLLGIGVYTICTHLNALSDQHFQRWLRWLDQLSDRVISFPEAAQSQLQRRWVAPTAWGLRAGVSCARGLSSAIRRAAPRWPSQRVRSA
ncbi:MAG: DUF2334 domain-containing protein [Pirellulaceae bacterium]|nr:DUF2334 domain-containing protein [Pirellulaceae bacterium]MDP7019375.1 DUF2334 domain-containing protein [Pirellulaceae bacterium]